MNDDGKGDEMARELGAAPVRWKRGGGGGLLMFEPSQLAAYRNAVLEEAARACEDYDHEDWDGCGTPRAAAIRALKR